METYTFDETHIGTVVKVDKENRRIGVYLPKLMPGMDSGEEISYKVPTNAGLTINDITTNISNTVTKTNYIWAKSYDYNEPLPKVGSKVLIEFLDDVCTQCYWLKFNPNNDYEIIDDEKYSKLYNLKIGNKEYEISEKDNVIIDIPSYYKINKIDDEKSTKHFEIQDNFNFYFNYSLEESIIKLQKSIEFLENQYEDTFITGINNIKYDFTIPPEISSSITKEVLSNNFEIYRNNAITNIKKSNDLAVSNDEFKYYSALLNGLISCFDQYKLYKKKYEDTFSQAYPENLLPEEIDNSLLSAFEKAEDITTVENIGDYAEYITEMYSLIATVKYQYYNKSNELTNKQKDYEIFSKLGNNILTLTDDDQSPNIGIIASNESLLKSSYIFSYWRDETGKKLDQNYQIFNNITVSPIYHGAYISSKNNKNPQVNIINDDSEIYKLSAIINFDSNTNLTFNSLIPLNNYLSTMDFNKNFKKITITITFGVDENVSLIWEKPASN